MKKTKEEKLEKRVQGFVDADRVEWERLIENPDLRMDIIQLQSEFGLPLDGTPQQMADWLGWTEPINIDWDTLKMIFGLLGQRREKLFKKIEELVVKYSINPKWIDELHLWVINDGIGWHASHNKWLPSIRLQKNEKGEQTIEIIITPETDLENPAVLGVIKLWRSKYRSTPPEPQSYRGNTRKLDWRPVWEWRKRHPGVTYDEIAIQLHRSPTRVRKALEYLDKES